MSSQVWPVLSMKCILSKRRPLPSRLRSAFVQEPNGKFAAPFRDGGNKARDIETPCGQLNSSRLDRTKALHILENALEIERLALVALQLVNPKPGNVEDLEKESDHPSVNLQQRICLGSRFARRRIDRRPAARRSRRCNPDTRCLEPEEL